MIIRLTCIVFALVAIFSCKTSTEENLLTDYPAIAEDGSVNAVIEIPAGTEQKWEVNKTSGIIEWEQVDGTGRIVNYIMVLSRKHCLLRKMEEMVIPLIFLFWAVL